MSYVDVTVTPRRIFDDLSIQIIEKGKAEIEPPLSVYGKRLATLINTIRRLVRFISCECWCHSAGDLQRLHPEKEYYVSSSILEALKEKGYSPDRSTINWEVQITQARGIEQAQTIQDTLAITGT